MNMMMIMMNYSPLRQQNYTVFNATICAKKHDRWLSYTIAKKLIQKENPTRFNSVSKFFISYLYEDRHVSGDTPPIIR